MPKLPPQNDSAPFQRIPAACRITGLSQVKAEIATELAEQLHRPVSAKARANIRQWYNITLAPDATYADALMAKYPWLHVEFD